MKSILSILTSTVLLLAIAAVTEASDAAVSLAWKSLQKGLAYSHVSQEGVTLHLFKTDLSRFTLSPLVTSTSTAVKESVETHRAIIGINANFFSDTGKPLGLVIQNHKILNPLRPVSWWGIFFIEGGRAAIVPQAGWQPRASIESALQSGPRLLDGGDIIAGLKNRDSPKSFLCITAPSEVVIGMTQDAMPMASLTAFLKNTLHCASALNLDGGSSSQLYAKIGKFELDLPSAVHVPVALGVFKK